MKNLVLNRNLIVSIFVVMLLMYGVQGISYGQDEAPTLKPGENNTSLIVSFSGVCDEDENAYQLQFRRKSPQGEWTTKCLNVYLHKHGGSVFLIFRSGGGTSCAGDLVIFGDLEPGVTYEARYRDTNLPACVENPPSPGPWSKIGEGTTHLVAPPRAEFVDATLAQNVRMTLLIGLSGPHIDPLKIPIAELERLTHFEHDRSAFRVLRDGVPGLAGREGFFVSDLTGLEHATQLMVLSIPGNNISNITPLGSLTRLTELDLRDNQISDITPLAELTQLTELDLSDNQISDITALAELTQLRELDLSDNRINNVRPLAELMQPTYLYLYNNQIRDVTPLVGLTSLKRLWIRNNSITDTSPLHTLIDENPEIHIDIDVTPPGATPKSGEHRTPFESSTPAGYARVTLSDRGTVYGVPTKYTSDSHPGTVAYMLLAKLKGCDFASAELSRRSKVYIKTQALGELSNFVSETVCGVTSKPWESSWNGVRITHLRFSDESGSSNINEALYNASTGQYELTSATATGENELTTTTPETPTDTGAVVGISPASVPSPTTGEQLAFSLNITDGEAVAGYQATLQFDTTALRFISGTNGDFLPAGAFFVQPKVAGNLVKLNAASLAGESNGDGTLATLTFAVIAAKASTLTLSDVLLTNSAGETFVPQLETAEITDPVHLKGDVNGDGVVNIADLVLVASNLSEIGQNAADVNGDGVVNIADLVLVAGALGTSAAAPALHLQSLDTFTLTDVEKWLSEAQQLNITDANSLKGILFLEQLLTALTPKETALLPNYPNPFNPETWIPYHLAKSAEVTLTIYAAEGQAVRRLSLGHQPAGMYQDRSRAAYWDGRNEVGEPAASGIYFYTLTAGDFTATRKMLIRK